ncbi:hypothetical protein [Halospeciosus flavus]|uniref:hypothetical protein n=1 Tax=Halospeciosus flavus TaxID=3032283 RepID=UPI00361620A5
MNRSRREVLAGLGAVAAVGAGVGWLRTSDLRPYSPNSTVSADRPTNERVVEAANRLLVLDHRADITVEVLRDGSGETPTGRNTTGSSTSHLGGERGSTTRRTGFLPVLRGRRSERSRRSSTVTK